MRGRVSPPSTRPGGYGVASLSPLGTLVECDQHSSPDALRTQFKAGTHTVPTRLERIARVDQVGYTP